MSDLAGLANPFRMWAELARGLRDRFLAELGKQDQPGLGFSPHCGEFVGTLAGLITTVEHMEIRLKGLERHDPPAFEAFLRALENS